MTTRLLNCRDIEQLLDAHFRRIGINDSKLLAHLLRNEKQFQTVQDVAGKKLLDFMLRIHLSSCMSVKPFPEPLYMRIPNTIIYNGILDKLLVNPVGVEVSVKV